MPGVVRRLELELRNVMGKDELRRYCKYVVMEVGQETTCGVRAA